MTWRLGVRVLFSRENNFWTILTKRVIKPQNYSFWSRHALLLQAAKPRGYL